MAPTSPTCAQDGPKLAPEAPKMAPEAPKLAREAPKMGPKWPQEGAQIALKSIFQGFPTSKPKKGVPPSISDADLGRFWDPLGAHVGPMLGPVRAQKVEGRFKRWPHNGPKMAKRGPRWPQDGPRGAQVGPKRGPKRVPDRSSKAFQHRSRKRECPGQSETPIWAVLGALLGPMLGLCWAP